jgi:hypothetical protein
MQYLLSDASPGGQTLTAHSGSLFLIFILLSKYAFCIRQDLYAESGPILI